MDHLSQQSFKSRGTGSFLLPYSEGLRAKRHSQYRHFETPPYPLPLLPILPGLNIYTCQSTYIAAGGDGMHIENIYPRHTTQEEWEELALLAAELLSTMVIPLRVPL